ncbi:hypothetical protein OEZ85_003177 [Tetradesmus obliquus]|uniref:DOMON domain-containing protein n=1 Tax=Tetradesmus obliquus TaxID=3088 RepID=A0ABY8U226_TETOB|nr:hypothetical protein OEZ85_003177 [Tetradesmus obliquus]
MALLFKAKGAAGYTNATTWTDAVKHVKYVQNPSGPPRPVITFPAADDFVHIDYLKLDWTMSAGSLGTASSYFLYMAEDIAISNPIRQPPTTYSDWIADFGWQDIFAGGARTAWTYTPVLDKPAYTGDAVVTLFACKVGSGCSKACPVKFYITSN